MSGIAKLLLARGVAVTGSDLKDSPALALLRASGAAVSVGHRQENLGDPDAVIVSTAVPPSNPEVRAARSRGIPVLARAQILAALMRERRGIGIAGTHGKTTTTSMVAHVLESAGRDPTYVVGGDLNESGSNARSGGGDLFVAEADESDGSFLLLEPEIAVVTNVEAEHLDFYSDLASLDHAFAEFCRRAGRVLVCRDDPGAMRAVAGREGATTYGVSADADVRIGEIGEFGGRVTGTITVGEHVVPVELGLPALAVGAAVGVDPAEGARALSRFRGVRRRFERRGFAGGAEFVDDYAHHPTEIAATLRGARTTSPGRLVAVFQPHRYSRTAALWRPLGESLAEADLVVVTNVYGAGEMPVPGVSGKLLVDALLESVPTKRIVYLPSRGEIAPFLQREVRDGDLVITLGAGDVTMVGEEALVRIREGSRDG
jgi:UDP-N-acetylmuramate--alanine ligase